MPRAKASVHTMKSRFPDLNLLRTLARLSWAWNKHTGAWIQGSLQITVYCFAKTILAKFRCQYFASNFRQNLEECKILLIFDLTSSISPSIIGPYGSLLMILTVVHYNGACHVKNCFSTLFAEKHLHFQINLFFHDIGTPNCTLPMSTPLSQKVKIY